MMTTHFNSYAISLVLGISVLAGCSSVPVEEAPGEVVDTTFQGVATDPAEVGSDLTDKKTVDTELVEQTTSVGTVFYFAFDKSLLQAESRNALLEQALVMRSNSRSIRLEGHADERGTREYNMALGERRALAVKEFLVFQGISANRIEVISYGEERPAAYGSNEQSWQLNRRVELK
jgi:peptidoglycan-associated lipoprotein